MHSVHESSRDWDTTHSLRKVEAEVKRLASRLAILERRDETLIERVKAEMWGEIWMERLKATTFVAAVVAIIAWAWVILG
jgi:hypothetical protein